MRQTDVTEILALARDAGARVWVAGGWGVDALVGRWTRDHADLDLLHRVEEEPALLAALAGAGFTETLDGRPARFVVADAGGREIDLHPLSFAPDGSAVQHTGEPGLPYRYPADCFVTGTIGGAVVVCVSVAQQLLFHQGYAHRDRDRHDMALLRDAFGVQTP
ncbi:nucleotidyltransferase domain-containing protein [Streptomyces spiramenti]|uniref:Amino acid transporter n=1 Tax=Streptomyces spiramenti TaxID=2720606 RepID=A0ABX1ASS6_9ACTN|nr:amino acid transporter [Streptomyces spiramenti]NJP68854.1 amino acid transporter [Streptomyces spiramenti]